MNCARCSHPIEKHEDDRFDCWVLTCECKAFVHPVPQEQRPLFREISMNAGRWP